MGSGAPVGLAEFYPGLKQEAFDQQKKLAIPMKLRAQTPTVVQALVTVVETKPCLNLSVEKNSASTFMSYSVRGRKPKGAVQGGGLCVLK